VLESRSRDLDRHRLPKPVLMSYYDDWVDPNAFFRGGSRLRGVRVGNPIAKKPRTHLADERGGCGAQVRLVSDREDVTCDNCLKRTRG